MESPTENSRDALLPSLDATVAPDRTWSEDVIERMRKGDADSGRRLFDAYAPALRRYARVRLWSTLRTVAESEDIVQTAFLTTWANRGGLTYQGPGKLLAYLRRCAENHIWEITRELARRPRSLGSATGSNLGLAAGTGDPGTAAERAELEHILDEAASTLPERQRQVLLLRYYLGGSWQEVAAELGISTHAAEQLFQRARLGMLRMAEPRLRGWLDATGDGPTRNSNRSDDSRPSA